MKKQTVQEVYEQQQTFHKIASDIKQEMTGLNQPQYVLQQANNAIQQAQQSVRQVQAGQMENLAFIDHRLGEAVQLIEQLAGLHIQSQLQLTESAYQQLKQLQAELTQATNTIHAIQQAQSTFTPN